MENKFIKKSFSNITVFAIIDVLLLVSAFWMANKINTTESAIKKFVASSENKSFRTDELRAALDKIRKTREEVEDYGSHLFKNGEELSLITDLENFADKNKVELQIINSNIDQIVNSKINMNLLITGTYNNVINYLTELESHSYFLSIESVDMVPNTDPKLFTNDSPVRMNIILSVYAE